MAKLPDISVDPTLKAADAAFERKGNREQSRPYLGMSGIGHPCMRKHWYDFRWCSKSDFDAQTLYRFDDGHRSEDIQADRLRLVDGIELVTIDYETGNQIEYSDIGGHFKGHADGLIKGLIQAPKTQHVWEHKAVNESKQKKLDKLKSDLGEKNALKEWDEIYYVQAMLYCKYQKAHRHYLTCASPGTRTVTSVRTESNNKDADFHIARARRVIESDVPPDRINNDPSFYLCSWCQHGDVCHSELLPVLPEVNCRTCIHSTPEMNGDGAWSCAWHRCGISTEMQRMSHQCPDHRYIPALVRFADILDADEIGNVVIYTNKHDGKTFSNGGENGYSSLEIKAATMSITDEGANEIKKPFPAAGLSKAKEAHNAEPKAPGTSGAASAETSATTNTAAPGLGLAMWKQRA